MIAKKNRNKLLLIFGALILVMLSCSELTVTNKAYIPIRIIVSMPKESVPETTLLDEDESDLFVSDFSGSYTVTAVADEDYRARLTKTRDDMTLLLLGNFDTLSQENISQITENLGQLEELLKNMKTVSCTGDIADNSRAYAEVSFNLESGLLVVTCD